MKDLYTFDHSESSAIETYEAVRDTYAKFFDEFKIPYLVAEADSGSMGGNLSHEYHFPSSKGEDNVISCDRCSYVANEELAESGRSEGLSPSLPTTERPLRIIDDVETGVEKSSASRGGRMKADDLTREISVWTGITEDRMSLVNVFYPSFTASGEQNRDLNQVNTFAVKRVVPNLDAGIEAPIVKWKERFQPLTESTGETEKSYSSVINVFDYRLPQNISASTFSNHADVPVAQRLPTYFSKQIPTTSITHNPANDTPLDLIKIRHGDSCPKCSDGRLRTQKAVELGHTFHLGTRYSEPLDAKVVVAPDPLQKSSSKEERVSLQMGCHGIGISRIIGAVAEMLADEKGLNWPRTMAPFEVVVISRKTTDDAGVVYDALMDDIRTDGTEDLPRTGRTDSKAIDVVLDDRAKEFVWKLSDADLIGYPVIVVLGRAWTTAKKCEVQCRRLNGLKTEVPLDQLRGFVLSLLEQL
ncbi:MAG: hypothetical protein M4579_005568 [Chaenotheca gracillima]|nr:MAG: hypothetical protein M4579_005568 [Chaenotheca gracillima]